MVSFQSVNKGLFLINFQTFSTAETLFGASTNLPTKITSLFFIVNFSFEMNFEKDKGLGITSNFCLSCFLLYFGIYQ